MLAKLYNSIIVEAVATLCLTEITAPRRKVISRLYLMTVKTKRPS